MATTSSSRIKYALFWSRSRCSRGIVALPESDSPATPWCCAQSTMVSILILTKNEEQDLPGCLESVRWSDDVHVFDSHSTDGTLEIARAAGASIVQRHFDNWSSHQNWALANISFRHPWVLYIDADERVTPELAVS